jgi:hypothetical protein
MVKSALHGYANREGMAVGGLAQEARALLGIAVRLVSQPTPPCRAAPQSESASPLLALRSHCVSVRERLLPWHCLLLSVGSYSAGCRVPYNMPLL